MVSKSGKLIKKENKKLMDTLEVEKYPWLHFNDQTVIFPDNPRKSVILQKMHDPQEMNVKITAARDFKKPLGSRAKMLLPTDMTLDFEKGRKEMEIRRRRTMMDEEEAMALELSEMEHEMEVNVNKKRNENSGADPQVKTPDKSMPVEKSNKEQELSFVPTEQQTEVKSEENIEMKTEDSTLKLKEQSEKIFNEAKNAGFNEGKEEGFTTGKKEGFEAGSRDGYLSGEERGMAAAESKYNRAFENISEVANRLSELRDSLIKQGKDIFVELTKLCCEKILKEQIKSSDASLAHLFDEILKTYTSKNSITIEMNSNDATRLRRHIEAKKEVSKIEIKENESLESGSFHVESDTGVSFVDLKKSVDNIVENLKDDLFQDETQSDNIKYSGEAKKA
ncbi:FliH/SctL family protein [Fluviispira vulneris]|uniref:FliH/SctL family protein n=1 Tax=Fluviispira vulneris TaxID=2763012 RepID=UPI001646BC81|nr:FliH/SctL family protein [Fluviispira vulneris]